jgi:SpoVK/Ycf46/Vps4 family AAA+-type ATPase
MNKYYNRNWNDFFSFNDSKRTGFACIIDIKLPTEDELRALINRERLLNNKKTSILEIDNLSKILLSYSKTKNASIQTIERKLKEIKVFNTENFKNTFNNKFSSISATERLNKMIGLKNAKNEIDSILKGVDPIKRVFNKNKNSIISNRFYSVNKLTLPALEHLAFLGNPGTGKTEVAKLIGEILKENGILESGHLVKVTEKDLCSEYVGGTAPKTYEKIQESIGGILFIDEAYSLTNNQYGKEAITTIIEAMTDLKGEFLIVLAGYTLEISELINTNPGFASRVKRINFENYNDNELGQIMELMFNKKNINISNIKISIPNYCRNLLHNNSSNKNWGNAREIENIISDVMRKIKAEKRDFVKFSDFKNKYWFNKETKVENNKFLKNMIGLTNVIEEINLIENRIKYEITLNEKPKPKNYIFIGNPGTGKTTVAKKMANILYELKVLKNNKIINKTAKDFIGAYIGETENKTLKVLKESLGGILFIDEAHQFGTSNSNGDGQKVIETLVPFMEDNKDKISIIIAGYPKQMEEMLKIDSGFKGRFDKIINFHDYSEEEMLQIFDKKIHKKISKESELDITLLKVFMEIKIIMKDSFANARTVNKFYDRIIDSLAKHNRKEIIKEDVEYVIEEIKKEYNITLNKDKILLEEMTGLSNVKKEIKIIEARIKLEKINNKIVKARNYIFVGNPGTGKTTVAKEMANTFYKQGLLKTNQINEITASSLIGRHVGDTENNTREILEKSIGSLLFIDEAHQLYSSNPNINNSFGKSVINTLVPFMTQHKGELSIIIAGYKKEINDMLKSDQGLKDRFSKVIEFKDYSESEMLEIFLKKLEYKIENNEKSLLINIFKEIKFIMQDKFANARTVEKFYDKLIDEIAIKYSIQNSNNSLIITKEDLNNVLSIIKEEYEK